MSKYASLSRLTFEPVAENIDLETVAVNYSTPAPLRERLYNLALMNANRATARVYIEHDSTQGTAVVRLTDGVTVAAEQEISLIQSPAAVSMPADLSHYRGSEALRFEVEVTGAGSAGAVGRMVADLTIETPLFITAGQC
ncbi:hypothetical protein LL254_04045 [Marinobacter nauticus]|uniref:hypothetical protein n=1 Tax=Marinobacter nauticus TaxID=2743 RepID=UPI001D188A70|nr:hypothetical protein [Marinobacter nauticus]MCC4269868.1 hypothetical protein [Marinobacter nauticus]